MRRARITKALPTRALTGAPPPPTPKRRGSLLWSIVNESPTIKPTYTYAAMLYALRLTTIKLCYNGGCHEPFGIMPPPILT